MTGFRRVVHLSLLALLSFSFVSVAHAQGAKMTAPETPVADADADHVQERADWFLRGLVPGKSSADLRHRAYNAKMQARAARLDCARASATKVSQPANHLIQRMDAAGPSAVGLRRYRHRISELRPSFWPGNRSGSS